MLWTSRQLDLTTYAVCDFLQRRCTDIRLMLKENTVAVGGKRISSVFSIPYSDADIITTVYIYIYICIYIYMFVYLFIIYIYIYIYIYTYTYIHTYYVARPMACLPI